MFYWIYDYPIGAIGVLFVVLFVAVASIGTLAVRKTLHGWVHREKRANEMVGFALSSFFVLYGLLLGLLAVAAYQNYATVSDIVDKEASSVVALDRDFTGYPETILGAPPVDPAPFNHSTKIALLGVKRKRGKELV